MACGLFVCMMPVTSFMNFIGKNQFEKFVVVGCSEPMINVFM